MPTTVDTALKNALVTLRTEKTRLERQIVALESAMHASDGSGRAGRTRSGAPRRRRPMSAAARKAIGERMKAYWAKRRASSGKAKAAKKS